MLVHRFRLKACPTISERHEKILFFGALLLTIAPLFLLRYTASLDGPKHLTASNIIGRLWLADPLFTDLFALNPIYTGNTLGIWILAILNLVLPAAIAEKIFLIIYMVAFSTGFRYLLRSFHSAPGFFSLLAFPFIHTSLFQMGYYNFSLAIALLFFTFGYWLRHSDELNKKQAFALSILLLLTYLTHIFVFFVLLFAISIAASVDLFENYKLLKRDYSRFFLKKVGFTFLAVVPSLILSGFYLRDIMLFQQSSNLRTTDADKLHDLIHFRMLVGFDPNAELPLYHALFVFMMVASIFVFVHRIIRIIRLREQFFHASDRFLILFFFLTAFYFWSPDGTDAAGSVGVRFLVLLAIVWALWISTQKFPFFIHLLPVAFLLVFGIKAHSIRYGFLKPLDNDICQIELFEKKIPDGNRVVTMNFSKNWLMQYFQNYIGMDGRLADLRGNSASPFMAFDWKNGRPDVTQRAEELHGFASDGQPPVASYVIVFEYRQFISEDTQPKLREILARDYEIVEISDSQLIALFTLKNAP